MPEASLHSRFRRAASLIPTGVAVLRAADTQMTVSTLQCVSFDPPWVSVAFSRTSRKAATILATGAFTARVLRHGEETAAHSGAMPDGAALVEMRCAIRQVHRVGDHDLALAAVEEVRSSGGRPLAYWRTAFHWLEVHYPFASSAEALNRFIAAWESGSLPKSDWTHGAHVTACAVYSVRYPGQTFERMRDGIRGFNEAVGTPNTDECGYHDTLTWFWASVIAKVVAGCADEWTAAQKAVTLLGEDRDLHHLYYSFDVVRSVEARRKWVAPDLIGPW